MTPMEKLVKLAKCHKILFPSGFTDFPALVHVLGRIYYAYGKSLTKAQRSSAFHNGTWFAQLRTNKFQGLFKDFSKTKIFFNKLASDPIG